MKKYAIIIFVFFACLITFQNVIAEVGERVNLNSYTNSVIEHVNEDNADFIKDNNNFRLESISYKLIIPNFYSQEFQFQIWKPPVKF